MGMPFDGLFVHKANPVIKELLRERGALMGEHRSEPQLSALLALPQAADLPRDGAVVHRDGDAGALAEGLDDDVPRAGAGGDGACDVGPGVGRGAHQQHDCDAAGLVHLAAAHLGRADCGVPVREVP